VVSRGGRLDLAEQYLPAVHASTLLLVGGNDKSTIDLNKRALRRLHCRNQLIILPGATHLFEEPGALDEVADLARIWFVHYLSDETDHDRLYQELGARFPREDMDKQC
jgi:putative phosphoribosyl transferase